MNINLNLNKLLHKGQKEVVRNLKRFTIIIAGRRWGKTRLAALILLTKSLEKKGIYWWIAPTYKQSDIAWNLLKKLVSKLPVEIKEADRKIQINGSEIVCKSADNPDNLRGEGLSGVVFDEAAFVKEEVWKSVIRPSLSDKQGWCIFISTPNSKNWFYKLTLEAEGKEDWIVFVKPTSDNPHIPANEIEDARNSIPVYVFEQEYLAKFLDDSTSVFRGISKVFKARQENKPKLHPKHEIVFGVDWGKENDFTVITGICRDCKEQVLFDRFNKIDYIFQTERLKAHYERWKPIRVIVEANSIGAPLIEQLKRDGLPIEGFLTTASSKPDLIENLSLAIETEVIKLIDEPVLMNELQLFGMETNKLGKRSYSAPSGYHDDCVISLALAWYGAKNIIRFNVMAL
jgi:hypothetical protein